MPRHRTRDADDIIAHPESIRPGDVAVLGLPWDGGSSYLPGTALAPQRIREELLSPARNLSAESGLDLTREPRFRVLPDVDLATGEGMRLIESAAAAIFARGGRPLGLGGDHSVTAALVRSCARHFDTLTLLQIDAHPDLYDRYQGDRDSHACPMARIMEDELVARLVQVGVRATTPHQRRQAERFGVEAVDMRRWCAHGSSALGLAGPLYVSIDLDGLDPAYAPGVSHPEPGGLSTREVIEILQGLPRPLVAADIVELNPLRDPQGLTAGVAAKLVRELAAKMLESTWT